MFGLRAVEKCRGIGLVLRFLGVLSCTEILIQDCSVDWFRVQCPISGSVRVVCLAWLFVGPGMWVIGLVPGFRVDGGVGVHGVAPVERVGRLVAGEALTTGMPRGARHAVTRWINLETDMIDLLSSWELGDELEHPRQRARDAEVDGPR